MCSTNCSFTGVSLWVGSGTYACMFYALSEGGSSPQVRRRLLDMGHKLVYQNFDENFRKPYNASAYFPQAFREKKQNQIQTQHKPDLEYSLLFQLFLQRGGNQPRFIQSRNEGKRTRSNVGCTGFLCTSRLTQSFYSRFIFSKWQIAFTRLLPTQKKI